ncbi:MAG: AsmA family protein [Bacteroidota bacterium]
MKRLLRRLFVILGIFLLLVVGVLWVATSFFADRIGAQVVEAVNAQLKTELQVQGFDLSFIRTFPNLGANLQGVQLIDTNGKALLRAEELSFRTGILGLFGSNLKIKSVVVRDGELNVAVDPRGNTNYDIFVETEDVGEEEANNSTIQLQEAIVRGMQLRYVDQQSKQTISLLIDDATFGGEFGAANYQLSSSADLFIAAIVSENETYISNEPFTYTAQLAVNTETGQYQIEQLELQLGDLPLVASGNFRLGETDHFIDMEVASNDAKLEDMISLLPASYKRTLKGIETGGELSFSADVEGVYAPNRQPKIEAELNFADGRLDGERIHARVRDLGFVAYFTNGDSQSDATSKLVLENLHGEFEREPFAMDLTVENFNDPRIIFAANGTLAPGALMGFIPDERISDGTGTVHLRNLRVSGRYKDMVSNQRSGRAKMSGELDFEGAGFTINGEDVQLSEGKVALDQNRLMVEGVKLEAPGTSMYFDGTATNILPVIFADSVNSKNARLQFDARLQATELDIDQLLALGDPAEEVQERALETGSVDSLAQAEVEKREYFTRFLDGTFAAEIQQFNYGEISGEDFVGSLEFEDGIMRIKGETKAMNGEFILDGEANFNDLPSLTAKLTGNSIDIYEFFRQSENFGQDFLVADNLSGQLDTRIYIECFFDEQGNFLQDKLRVLAGVGVNDGVLQDFAMLENFSTFVNVRDLREIRFSNLENFFEVRNSKLYLPVMFIQSNALNMTISGEHTFDQDIAYYVKVNAGQVLADRFRRHNPRLRPKPARRRGFFNLYYAILGNLDDYNFSSDKRRVQNDFRESESRKRDIHLELERRFGTIIELVEEPLDWRDIPEYEEDPDSDDPEFLDMEIEGGNSGGNRR